MSHLRVCYFWPFWPTRTVPGTSNIQHSNVAQSAGVANTRRRHKAQCNREFADIIRGGLTQGTRTLGIGIRAAFFLSYPSLLDFECTTHKHARRYFTTLDGRETWAKKKRHGRRRCCSCAWEGALRHAKGLRMPSNVVHDAVGYGYRKCPGPKPRFARASLALPPFLDLHHCHQPQPPQPQEDVEEVLEVCEEN